MSEDLLNIFDTPTFDDSLTCQEYHTYLPYNSNAFQLSDEVRICVQSNDHYSAPCDSYLYLEGVIASDAATATTPDIALTNNAFAFLFDEIRYELNGVEIDRCKNVGITTTMKGYVSIANSESKAYEIAGFVPKGHVVTIQNQKFNACIPLKFILGFAEDYKKIIINSKQELILVLARTDKNAYKANVEANVTLKKIQWRLPHISVNLDTKLTLVKALNDNNPLNIAFRKWQLYELPALKASNSDTWAIKTSTNLSKPRYVIISFQTKRKNTRDHDSSTFDHVNIRNVRLTLNSQNYPYDAIDFDFGEGRYSQAYQMYANFQKSYYQRASEPIINYKEFLHYPMFVIDVSNQNDADKNSTVDVQLSFEAHDSFPEGTSAYCLIISDSLFEYYPLTGIVNKLDSV